MIIIYQTITEFAGLPEKVEELLQNDRVIKFGWGISNDLCFLMRYSLVTAQSVMNLAELKDLGTSLASAVKSVLHKTLRKPNFEKLRTGEERWNDDGTL